MSGFKTGTLLLACAALTLWQSANSQDDDAALERATSILQSAPIVDGHNDLPWVIREKFGGDVEGYDISVRAQYDTDLPRMRDGLVGTQFWSVYVPSSMSPVEAMTAQLEQIDIALRIINMYPDDLMLATSVADIDAAMEQGKIASLLGMEGGHPIVNSLGALRSYYDLGVRYMTLTHFHSNDWADSATDDARHGRHHRIRQGSHPRDESSRHVGRPVTRVRRDHERRTGCRGGAGHIFAFIGEGNDQSCAQCAGQRPRKNG